MCESFASWSSPSSNPTLGIHLIHLSLWFADGNNTRVTKDISTTKYVDVPSEKSGGSSCFRSLNPTTDSSNHVVNVMVWVDPVIYSDVLFSIMSMLTLSETIRASSVCRQWHSVAISEAMWQCHHIRSWGLPPSLRVLSIDGAATATSGIIWRNEVYSRIVKEPRSGVASHRSLLPPALAAVSLPPLSDPAGNRIFAIRLAPAFFLTFVRVWLVQKIKLVLVGDGLVGKTCSILTYTNGSFPGAYVPIGLVSFAVSHIHLVCLNNKRQCLQDNESKNIVVDGRNYNCSLWDTAGYSDSDYDRFRPQAYPKTDCFLICFNTCSKRSLNRVR
jgi:hypothetical protein